MLECAVLTCALFENLSQTIRPVLYVKASKEVDRKSERLKYVITAPGLVIIALLLGFLSIFVGVSVRLTHFGSERHFVVDSGRLLSSYLVLSGLVSHRGNKRESFVRSCSCSCMCLHPRCLCFWSRCLSRQGAWTAMGVVAHGFSLRYLDPVHRSQRSFIFTPQFGSLPSLTRLLQPRRIAPDGVCVCVRVCTCGVG